MPFTDIRTGADTKIAMKFQASEGTPATTILDADLMRFTNAPAATEKIEVFRDRPSTGTLYPLSRVPVINRKTPTVEGEVKASPEALELLFRSFISITPTVDGVFKRFDGEFKPFIPADQRVTYIWDDGFESLRVTDLWVNKLTLTSTAKGHLMVNISGVGTNFEKFDSSLLAGRTLVNFESYTHNESNLFTINSSTEAEIASFPLLSMDISFEHEAILEHGNSILPTFVGKGGAEIRIAGSLTFRLDADSKSFYDDIRNLTLVGFKGTWKTETGRELEIFLKLTTLEGGLPSVSEDGTMSNFTINFVAHEDDESAPLIKPFKVRVEV